MFDNPLGPEGPPRLGEGRGLSSLVLMVPSCLGFEKSFIFDLSVFKVCFSNGDWKEVSPGDSWALRGNAAFAAVAAAL